MTIQQAILASAVIVSAAIIGARFVAPYEMTTSGQVTVWRLNTVTGAVDLCRVPGMASDYAAEATASCR